MNGRTARAGAAIALVAAAYAGPGATATAAGNPPEINYMLHCQGCHLPGGIGHPGIVPKMQGEIGAFLASAAGRAYLVQVPGAAQSSLDDAELAAVLNWMLPAFDKRVTRISRVTPRRRSPVTARPN